MAGVELGDVVWYTDRNAEQRAEPGVCHSFMASLATAINYIAGDLDPVWLMGSSSFAFRIMVNENLCPSAMSIFNWLVILPEAVENSGYSCTYISRMWEEGDKEAERREQAHVAIIDGLNAGRPAIAWDVSDAEWGLIIGYDDGRRVYHALSNTGKPVTLASDRLGRNGINILSVTIPQAPNGRTREEMIINSLRAAVNHAEEKEWMDRPKYRDGLPAYDQWSLIYDQGAMIADAGRGQNLPKDVLQFASYYAAHYCSARCYARDYLRMIGNGEPHLAEAAGHYDRVATFLKSVWESASQMKKLDDAALLRAISRSIKEAGAAEKEGIEEIKAYLASKSRFCRSVL
jgi:hypothetical protein